MKEDDLRDGKGEGGAAVGHSRVREAIEAACGTCPERDGSLRRELLCRCPVALAARCLLKAERHGSNPRDCPPAELMSLAFQERSLMALPDGASVGPLSMALERFAAMAHRPCSVPRCLACRAMTRIEGLPGVAGDAG